MHNGLHPKKIKNCLAIQKKEIRRASKFKKLEAWLRSYESTKDVTHVASTVQYVPMAELAVPLTPLSLQLC